MQYHEDDGPAFPEPGLTGLPNGEFINGRPGMSKRELFAAILMHSEAVTCGVPGEASDALVEASRAAGTDVIDHMAMNAVQGADALLRALAGPQPPQYRELYPSEKWLVQASEQHRSAMYALRQHPAFDSLPPELREQISKAVVAFEDAEIPF